MSDFQCGFCEKIFPSTLELWFHMLETHGAKKNRTAEYNVDLFES